MATPTPTTYTQWDGSRGMTYWDAVWTTADNFTDTVVVDISTLTPVPVNVKVLGIYAALNGDVSATVEIDATTDALVFAFRGQTDASLRESIDFREAPSGGRCIASSTGGFVGDIILTTANVASGDEITLLVFFERKA